MMVINNNQRIVLESLDQGIPVLTTDAAGFYKENCLICLDECGHKSGVLLKLKEQQFEEYIEVQWTSEITTQMKMTHADLVQATEFGACAIALLIIRDITKYTAVSRAVIGTTIDYYLAPKDSIEEFLSEETLIFNQSVLLEATGILKETKSNSVYSRMNKKLDRLKNPKNLRTFIIVVEFSKPWSLMERA